MALGNFQKREKIKRRNVKINYINITLFRLFNVITAIRCFLSCFSFIVTDTESVPSVGGKSRKGRNNFSPKQIEQLEIRYQQQRYLSPEERTQLARKLRLSDRQVKTWFQSACSRRGVNSSRR